MHQFFDVSGWYANFWKGRIVQVLAKEQYLGCLLGGAVGDALGAPVEFMSKAQIQNHFGEVGITRYAPAYGRLGAVTDDTQMTLFTAEGLLRAWVRACNKGMCGSYSSIVANAYLRWLSTQGEKSAYRLDEDSDQSGWLIKQSALHHRRAPGRTCLVALCNMRHLHDQAQNTSKGCGGVMRVAPVGLFLAKTDAKMGFYSTFDDACEIAGLTHGHPTGKISSGAFAVIIAALVTGFSLEEAIKKAKTYLIHDPDAKETLVAIEMAENLAQSKLPRDQAIEQLGQGWIAEEALAISIYCALVAKDFEDGVILAVNHSGDSDSTGAITGNILGALYGVDAIPSRWLSALELKDVIAEIATDLYEYRNWDIGEYCGTAEFNHYIWEKYPGH